MLPEACLQADPLSPASPASLASPDPPGETWSVRWGTWIPTQQGLGLQHAAQSQGKPPVTWQMGTKPTCTPS